MIGPLHIGIFFYFCHEGCKTNLVGFPWTNILKKAKINTPGQFEKHLDRVKVEKTQPMLIIFI